MPRKGSGGTQRWVSNISDDLAEDANAVRQRHGGWLSKSLLIQFALEHYVRCVKEGGPQSVLPFNYASQAKKAVPSVPVPKSATLQ